VGSGRGKDKQILIESRESTYAALGVAFPTCERTAGPARLDLVINPKAAEAIVIAMRAARSSSESCVLQCMSPQGPRPCDILLHRATPTKTPVSAPPDCQNRKDPFLGCPRAILGLPIDANSGVHGAPHAAIAASKPFTPTIAITRFML